MPGTATAVMETDFFLFKCIFILFVIFIFKCGKQSELLVLAIKRNKK